MERQSDKRSLDIWLRFDRETARQHEHERGMTRRQDLSRGIVLGLIFYNLYNFTSIFLMPDILWTSVALRLGLVTPGSLILAYLVLVVGPSLREQLVLSGMVGAIALPIGLFWYSDAPLSAFSFGELPLTLAFGNMLLPLRFRHAAVFSASAVCLAIAATFAKPDLADGLAIAFALQIVTAATFTLLANYLSERRRCMDYLKAVIAEDRARMAVQETKALNVESRTDPLTGLPNRRAWDEAVDAAFAEDSTLAILILDIDHFKRYNDTLGHQSGDECLKTISSELALIAEERNAFAARFGGEEFVFLLIETTKFEAARLCQIVVRRIEALQIEHPGRSDWVPVVTVSVGLALREAGSTATIAQVIGNADVALYQAKQRGRNQFYWDAAEDRLLAKN